MIVVWKEWFLKDQHWLLFHFFYVSNLKYASIDVIFEIFGNMFIVILRVPVCDVINFEIYLTLLIKSIAYNKKCFSDETKNIHHF